MFNPNKAPQFITRTKEPAPLNLEAGIEYQRKYREYFRDLLVKIGFDPEWHLFRQETPERQAKLDSATSCLYTTTSLEASDYINEEASRFDLLNAKEGIDFEKSYSQSEMDQIVLSRVNFEALDAELARPDTDTAHRNILTIIDRLAGRSREVDPSIVKLPWRGSFSNIGSCREAEGQTLSFISGNHSKQHLGRMNVIVDAQGKPLMLEKVNNELGENYSCLSLQPVMSNGFRIESGALFAVWENKSRENRKPVDPQHGLTEIIQFSDCRAFQFLRYSPLSIPPHERALVAPGFASLYKNASSETNFDWITPEIIAEFAKSEIDRLKG